MDGNRRFAREQGKPTLEGHLEGLARFRDSVGWVREAGIPHAVYYAFSTENWKRSEAEVAYLVELFASNLQSLAEQIDDHRVRWRFIGRRSDFPVSLQETMEQIEKKSVVYDGTTIWVGLSYGGRAEIVAAVNAAITSGVSVDETSFSALLWSAGMPDPDLIIRTGGEQRLSNFLPWQSVYSEFCFTATHWPAFTKEEFMRMLDAYAARQRRIGT